MLEDRALVVVEDDYVDIPVMARLPAEPGVGRPPTTEEPLRAQAS
jgi:hypothetical protein